MSLGLSRVYIEDCYLVSRQQAKGIRYASNSDGFTVSFGAHKSDSEGVVCKEYFASVSTLSLLETSL
jgi:hypothetical protein